MPWTAVEGLGAGLANPTNSACSERSETSTLRLWANSSSATVSVALKVLRGSSPNAPTLAATRSRTPSSSPASDTMHNSASRVPGVACARSSEKRP